MYAELEHLPPSSRGLEPALIAPTWSVAQGCMANEACMAVWMPVQIKAEILLGTRTLKSRFRTENGPRQNKVADVLIRYNLARTKDLRVLAKIREGKLVLMGHVRVCTKLAFETAKRRLENVPHALSPGPCF